MARRERVTHYPGVKAGALTLLYVIKEEKVKGRRIRTWHCKCDCGRYVDKNTQQLIRMSVPSCGCIRTYRKRGLFRGEMLSDEELMADELKKIRPATDTESEDSSHWLWRTEDKFRATASGTIFQVPK